MISDVLTIAGDERLLHVLTMNSLFAAVVFVPVAVAAYFTKRLDPSLRLALWSLVFVRLVLPPDFSHRFSLGAILPRFLGAQVPGPEHGALLGPMSATADPVVVHTVSTGAAAPDWPLILIVLWLIGFALCLAAYVVRRAPFRRALAAAEPVRSARLVDLAEAWRHRFGIRRRVILITGGARVAPFTSGVLRPVIYLPAPVVGGGRAVEPVIAHEMAHVARFDAGWLVLQQLIQAVYFFHPLVWISGARLDDEREELCDATVLARNRLHPQHYAGGLLDVLRLDLRGAGAPTMNARNRRIKVRFLNIINRRHETRPRIGVASAVALLAVFFALPMAAVPTDPVPTVAAVPTAPGAPVGPDATAAPPAPTAEPAPAPSAPTHPLAAPAKPPAAPVPSARPAPPVAGAPVVAPESALPPSAPEPPAAPEVMDNPLPNGRITAGWGPMMDPFTHKERFHRGVDIAAPAGTPIRAPADGIVTVATVSYEPSEASGTVVVVEHDNGLATVYTHLGSLEVDEGQRVARGDVLATVGTSGKSTGPHLHFEVHREGAPEDPSIFVADWR